MAYNIDNEVYISLIEIENAQNSIMSVYLKILK